MRDRYHQPGPVKLGVVPFLGIHGFAEQFKKKVPERFWTPDNGEAIVDCTCGTRLAVHGLTSCTCERFFLYTGREVRVARYQ